MYKLFKFQEEAVTNCVGFFLNSELNSGLAIMPTASGKSVVIASVVSKLDNCLILVPSSELLVQNEQAMINIGIKPCVYSASVDRREMGKITLATIGSIKELGKDLKKAGITNLICDEAHFKLNFGAEFVDENLQEGMFRKLLNDLKPKKKLGLTATPFINGTIGGKPAVRMLNRVKGSPFKEIIHITQFQEVIKEGRWQTLTYHQHPVNTDSLKQSSNVEYTKESIELFLRENGINNRICLMLKKYQKEKTLTFTDSLDTALKMRDWYNKNEFYGRCEVVSGDMNKKERTKVISEFKDLSSDLMHVINYGTLTTGFDFPQLSHVIGGRPTNSLSLYYQMCGRGGRVHKDKTFCNYYDLVGNVAKFGKVESFNFDNVSGMGWRMFSEDNLLTDIPLPAPFNVTKQMLSRPPKMKKLEPFIIWFGKYEGKDVRFLPAYYKKYLLENLNPPVVERDFKLREALEVSDTNEFIKNVFK